MNRKSDIDLEEECENQLPRLFNWSVQFVSGRPDGASALLLASTEPHRGTKPHQRATPQATTVRIPLGTDEILSLMEALEEVIQVQKLGPSRRAH